MKSKLIDAIHRRLFSSNALKTALSSRIAYARAPVSSTWPQMIYFDVTDTQGYLVDFDSVTIQFSIWANNAPDVLKYSEIVRGLMTRLHGNYPHTTGNIFINWAEMIDAGQLPGDDQQLHGQFLRVKYNYRGQNLGG